MMSKMFTDFMSLVILLSIRLWENACAHASSDPLLPGRGPGPAGWDPSPQLLHTSAKLQDPCCWRGMFLPLVASH